MSAHGMESSMLCTCQMEQIKGDAPASGAKSKDISMNGFRYTGYAQEVIFGAGSLAQLSEIIERFGWQRCDVVLKWLIAKRWLYRSD